MGNDLINGTTNYDVINGGAGNDTINGNFGSDVISGGTGNDLLCGEADNDTYIFNVGDGNDTIYDIRENNQYYDAGTADKIQFNVSQNNVAVTAQGENLIITCLVSLTYNPENF